MLFVYLFHHQIKKDYMEGMTDSVDLVPIGAWRSEENPEIYSSFLLACFDDDDENYQSIAKVIQFLFFFFFFIKSFSFSFSLLFSFLMDLENVTKKD